LLEKRKSALNLANTSQADSQFDDVEFNPEIVQGLKKLVDIQRLVEEDENLGVPEAQATLEVLYYFNQDASQMADKMT
jgi:hypothetical protein